MSNLVDYANSELKLAGFFDEDSDYGGMLGESVVKMIEQFAEQGHSGASAGMAIRLFERLAQFEPLTPLTGEDSEWKEHNYGEGPIWQNNRCSRVFKESDGRAYDINGTIFREPNGMCYGNRDSRVYIEFPYTPKTEYVDEKEHADME